jgi:hypothetical protein
MVGSIRNTEGNKVKGFERQLDQDGVASVISRAMKSKDYLKAKDSFEYRLIERDGAQFIQLRKKPGKLASFFASAQTKARVAEERKKGIEAVMDAFSNVKSAKIDDAVKGMKSERGSLRPTVEGATQYAQATVGYVKGMYDVQHTQFARGGDVDAEHLDQLLAMSDEQYEISPFTTYALDGGEFDGRPKKKPAEAPSTKVNNIANQEVNHPSYEDYDPANDTKQAKKVEIRPLKQEPRQNTYEYKETLDNQFINPHESVSDSLSDEMSLRRGYGNNPYEQFQSFLRSQLDANNQYADYD